MACGIATLKVLKKNDPYIEFEIIAKRLEKILLEKAKENKIDLQVNRFGSMINPFFTSKKVIDFKSAQTSDTKKFKTFFWKMIENGVFLPPSQFESWFLSTKFSKKDLKKTELAIDKAMKSIAKI
jgi:glutamate-1-semialdehyde 2,1-aminomutase